jgi:methylated-DNA-[protein]-cysteine S-methyltransferase
MAWRGVCSTGIVTIGAQRLRVAWTSAGIAFVDDEEPGIKYRIEKRTKMQLVEKPVPAVIRRALVKAAQRPGGDDAPIDLTWARDYERDVLLAARTIPWGQTRPYSWLAREARRPLAVRAAASVIARDPLWLLVPWHRVVYKDGKIGAEGSAYGKRKREMLAREAKRSSGRAGAARRARLRGAP